MWQSILFFGPNESVHRPLKYLFSSCFVKITVGMNLIIHQSFIREGLGSFHIKNPGSVQKLIQFWTHRLSVVVWEDFWVSYPPKAPVSVVNEHTVGSPKPPKVNFEELSKLQKCLSLNPLLTLKLS
jgi:hypothetical protein